MKRSGHGRQWGIFFLVFGILLGLGGCKKETTETAADDSVSLMDWCYTSEGLLYQRAKGGADGIGRVEYYDYETGAYLPLCAKANCLHQDEECMAVYLGQNAEQIGRCGGNWYYHVTEAGGTGSFRRCELDGSGEVTVGAFPHRLGWKAVYEANSCITLTWDLVLDETKNEVIYRSGIYRINLENGKAEPLLSETESDDMAYELYGIYGKLLVYGEKEQFGYRAGVYHLDTGETDGLFQGQEVLAGNLKNMDGSRLLCAVRENGSYTVKLIDMDSMEEKTVMEGLSAGPVFCADGGELLMSMPEETKAEASWSIYRIQEDGVCEKIRMETGDSAVIPIAVTEKQVVGRPCNDEAQALAVMPREEFLKGSGSWEERKAE